jgi:predicted nuclease with RNAse H fold
MLSLGVDLASQANKTSVALVSWTAERALALAIEPRADDDAIVAQAGRADVVGIDAPFGWPRRFFEFVAAHRVTELAPAPWSNSQRDELRFRLTDRHVRARTGRWPLSVSSDLIGVPAMRCAALLARLGVRDRAGDGRIFEVYPAAALPGWGLPTTSYKGGDRRPARVELLAALLRAAPWLELPPPLRARCEASDDCLDALLAALVGRAAALGLTHRPTAEELHQAREEGWIALPLPGSLERLLGAATT